MPVDLYNKKRRMQVITLPHDSYCRALGRCRCVRQTVRTVRHDGRTGKKTPHEHVAQVPASLSIPALDKAENWPDAILQVPELQDAVRSGRILVKVREVRKVEKDPEKPKPKSRDSKKKKK